jgi:hypothetical protein
VSTARSIARPSASPIASRTPIIGGGLVPPAFDADALDYFSRAEALGGSFNQTGINALYTETYVKTAISNFIAGCKTDAIWSKLTEIYLLAGVSFGGITAKVKHGGTATLTNENFVSGDYLAAGATAGCKGAATKRMLTGVARPAWGNVSLSAYLTEADNVNNRCYIGAGVAAASTSLGRLNSGNDEVFQDANTAPAYAALTNARRNGYFVGTSRSTTDRELYRNGASIATNTTTNTQGTITNQSFELFSMGQASGVIQLHSEARITFFHIGVGITDEEQVLLSNRVNALMTAIGANVY